MSSRLVLVRHAPPLVRGICAGRADIDVETAAGSATTVWQRVPTSSVKRIISSPSRRCRDLATELARRAGLPLSHDERLRELDFGAWEGLSWTQIEASDGKRLAHWMQRWQLDAPPGGEGLQELEQRVRGFLSEVSDGLVITHAGVIRAVRVIALGWDWPRAMQVPVEYLDPLPISVRVG
jgi:alpha-ribazole phosphatase